MRARWRVALQRDGEIRPTCGTGTHMRAVALPDVIIGEFVATRGLPLTRRRNAHSCRNARRGLGIVYSFSAFSRGESTRRSQASTSASGFSWPLVTR